MFFEPTVFLKLYLYWWFEYVRLNNAIDQWQWNTIKIYGIIRIKTRNIFKIIFIHY